MSRELSARISLLDAQLVDRERLPIGRIDDVELEPADDGPELVVTTLLTGSQALGERLGGTSGRAMAAATARLREDPGPTRLDPRLVEQVEPFVKLSLRLTDLDGVAGLERWLSSKVISKLPGAGDAVE